MEQKFNLTVKTASGTIFNYDHKLGNTATFVSNDTGFNFYEFAGGQTLAIDKVLIPTLQVTATLNGQQIFSLGQPSPAPQPAVPKPTA